MRKVSLLQYKGGSAKTTLSIQLAATATVTFGLRTVLLDTDAQASSANWCRRRGRDDPTVLQVDPANAVDLLREVETTFDLALIDTPGHDWTALSRVAVCADFSVVPCSPTQIDVETASQVCSALRDFDIQHALLLSQASPRTSAKLASWKAVCARQAVTVPSMMTRLVDYQDSITLGLGVAEYAPHGRAAEEVRKILEWILRRMEG